MSNKNIDYIDLIEIAKINLANKLNEKVEEYKKERTPELKREVAKLMQEREEIYKLNKKVIEKYI